jgi:hypothetical protein
LLRNGEEIFRLSPFARHHLFHAAAHFLYRTDNLGPGSDRLGKGCVNIRDIGLMLRYPSSFHAAIIALRSG